ncbi:hypothetical protein QYE76_055046 [Lolium multiflorum]|uniref:EF-hand domain-containing protein n=1 Tax=Lolium multiflorum TaxID=4521 RepID=A0AAD8SZN8_LOLMU|nr:hypothetical protein QYE76_055046 [Lolium multiflorum]
MVAAVDTDGDGFINIEKFGALLDDGESDALRMAFEEYDENGDMMITAEESAALGAPRRGSDGREVHRDDSRSGQGWRRCNLLRRVQGHDGDQEFAINPFLVPVASSESFVDAPKDPDIELLRVFKSFDTDADDRILASEIQKLRRCTTTEAKEMVAAVDTEGDRFISIEEFRTMLDDGESDALCMAFEETRTGGMITAEELCRGLRQVLPDEDLTVEKCAEMIAGVDKDGGGVTSFDEFKAMTTTKSS